MSIAPVVASTVMLAEPEKVPEAVAIFNGVGSVSLIQKLYFE